MVLSPENFTQMQMGMLWGQGCIVHRFYLSIQ